MAQKRLTSIARRLRRERTDVEDRLWFCLRGRRFEGAKFRFQEPVGAHVGDFVCHAARLIVELDGSQHADQVEADAARTRSLEQAGYTVLRFWNSDVNENMEGVLEAIRHHLIVAGNR